MNPPLREAADVAAIREGLADGTIDAIASDHAPHHYDAKEREFDDAPFGIVGLETALALGITELVGGGVLTLSQLLERMSTQPARVFGLPGGTLKPGAPADLVVFDARARWTVEPGAFKSKSRNTPFAGRELTGRVERTFVAGRAVFTRAGARR
jgi:dihydroorotase